MRQGIRKYLIKWENYAEAESTWEPEENLSCPVSSPGIALHRHIPFCYMLITDLLLVCIHTVLLQDLLKVFTDRLPDQAAVAAKEQVSVIILCGECCYQPLHVYRTLLSISVPRARQ